MSPREAAQKAVRTFEAERRRQSFASDLATERARRNGREADAAGFVIHTLTAAELCALPDPPNTAQLLGELLVRGERLVIGGQTGEGKTTLALSVVGAVALERTFLDWRGAGGRILVLDAEQGLKTINRRLRELGLNTTDHIDLARVPDGLNLDRDRDHIAAVERLLEHGNYSAGPRTRRVLRRRRG